jgi:hypothetical protein
VPRDRLDFISCFWNLGRTNEAHHGDVKKQIAQRRSNRARSTLRLTERWNGKKSVLSLSSQNNSISTRNESRLEEKKAKKMQPTTIGEAVFDDRAHWDLYRRKSRAATVASDLKISVLPPARDGHPAEAQPAEAQPAEAQYSVDEHLAVTMPRPTTASLEEMYI